MIFFSPTHICVTKPQYVKAIMLEKLGHNFDAGTCILSKAAGYWFEKATMKVVLDTLYHVLCIHTKHNAILLWFTNIWMFHTYFMKCESICLLWLKTLNGLSYTHYLTLWDICSHTLTILFDHQLTMYDTHWDYQSTLHHRNIHKYHSVNEDVKV